jgi:hypothetical protein
MTGKLEEPEQEIFSLYYDVLVLYLLYVPPSTQAPDTALGEGRE